MSLLSRHPPPHLPLSTPVQMPNVFVVPPDEDQTPAWCFFDANQPDLASVVDTVEDDVPTFVFQSRRDKAASSTRSPSPRPLTSVVDALMDNDERRRSVLHTDTDDEGEEDNSPIQDEFPDMDDPRPETPETPAEDSIVVEVFKVRRIRQSHEQAREGEEVHQNSAPKRSKTLKSRASRAFRSLRGTLRSSSKPRAEGPGYSDTPPVPPVPPLPTTNILPENDTVPRSRGRPAVSRRASTILSLFKTPSIRSQSSTASFDDPNPLSNTDPSPPTRLSQTSDDAPLPSPTSTSSRRLSVYDAEGIDEARLQAASPTPTTASTKSKSTRRRFSVLSLQKLFSLPSGRPSSDSSYPKFDDDDDVPEPHTRPPSRTAPSASSSITTTSGPQTPTSARHSGSVCVVEPEAKPSSILGFESEFTTAPRLNLTLDLASGYSTPQPTTPRSHRSKPTWDSESLDMVTPKKNHNFVASGLQTPTKKRAGCEVPDLDGDTSLEMKLDSLHFDDLSFDANRFILSSP